MNFSITLGQNGSRTYRGTVFNLHVPGVGPAIVEAGIAEFGPDGGVVRISGLTRFWKARRMSRRSAATSRARSPLHLSA